MDGLGFTHDKFMLLIESNHDVNQGTLNVLLHMFYSRQLCSEAAPGRMVATLFSIWLEHAWKGQQGTTTHLVGHSPVMRC